MKKILAVVSALVLALGIVNILSAPRSMPERANAAENPSSGSVYYLNFKPEQAAQWEQVAAQYTQLTGVPVTVVTAVMAVMADMAATEVAAAGKAERGAIPAPWFRVQALRM